MENIILTLHHSDLNTDLLDFSCYLASESHAPLSGLFLDTAPGVSGAKLPNTWLEERTKYHTYFENACEQRSVQSATIAGTQSPLLELLDRARFADLLIIPGKAFHGKPGEEWERMWLNSLLATTSCPIVIAPEHFDGIDEVFYCYDGRASSVLALRQFYQTLPGFCDRKLTILHVKHEAVEDSGNQIRSLAQAHFKQVEYVELYGNPSAELLQFLLGKRNAFVIFGSFGRAHWPLFSRRSRTDFVSTAIDLPLFIAHH